MLKIRRVTETKNEDDDMVWLCTSEVFDVPHMSCENEECEMKEISVVSHGSLEQKV